MLPVIYGENMFDDFFDNNGFFGTHNPLFGKNGRNLMKTDIRETDDAKSYRMAIDLPGVSCVRSVTWVLARVASTSAMSKPRTSKPNTRTVF